MATKKQKSSEKTSNTWTYSMNVEWVGLAASLSSFFLTKKLLLVPNTMNFENIFAPDVNSKRNNAEIFNFLAKGAQYCAELKLPTTERNIMEDESSKGGIHGIKGLMDSCGSYFEVVSIFSKIINNTVIKTTVNQMETLQKCVVAFYYWITNNTLMSGDSVAFYDIFPTYNGTTYVKRLKTMSRHHFIALLSEITIHFPNFEDYVLVCDILQWQQTLQPPPTIYRIGRSFTNKYDSGVPMIKTQLYTMWELVTRMKSISPLNGLDHINKISETLRPRILRDDYIKTKVVMPYLKAIYNNTTYYNLKNMITPEIIYNIDANFKDDPQSKIESKFTLNYDWHRTRIIDELKSEGVTLNENNNIDGLDSLSNSMEWSFYAMMTLLEIHFGEIIIDQKKNVKMSHDVLLYVLCELAQMYQRPTESGQFCLYLIGEQGNFKSFLMNIIRSVFGERLFETCSRITQKSDDKFTSKGDTSGCLVATLIDDQTLPLTEKDNAWLKNYVTGESITIREMHKASYTVEREITPRIFITANITASNNYITTCAKDQEIVYGRRSLTFYTTVRKAEVVIERTFQNCSLRQFTDAIILPENKKRMTMMFAYLLATFPIDIIRPESKQRNPTVFQKALMFYNNVKLCNLAPILEIVTRGYAVTPKEMTYKLLYEKRIIQCPLSVFKAIIGTQNHLNYINLMNANLQDQKYTHFCTVNKISSKQSGWWIKCGREKIDEKITGEDYPYWRNLKGTLPFEETDDTFVWINERYLKYYFTLIPNYYDYVSHVEGVDKLDMLRENVFQRDQVQYINKNMFHNHTIHWPGELQPKPIVLFENANQLPLPTNEDFAKLPAFSVPRNQVVDTAQPVSHLFKVNKIVSDPSLLFNHATNTIEEDWRKSILAESDDIIAATQFSKAIENEEETMTENEFNIHQRLYDEYKEKNGPEDIMPFHLFCDRQGPRSRFFWELCKKK